jgi:hypothetical protein
MVETQTSWKDSGYDCDHCGGQILKRTDRETGQPTRVCFQCELCGCQWTLSGDVQRVGNLSDCLRAQRQRQAEPVKELSPFFIASVVIGGIILLLAIVSIGGLVALRFIIPAAIAVFVFVSVYRLGKERMWW